MAQPKDQSEARVLPDPELNPLLNPLLAAHMGRWAEVFFTSPPEKRTQAVSDLVRELAKGSTPDYVSTQGGNDDESMHRSREDEVIEPTEVNEPEMEDLISGPLGPAVVCESCGHRNAALQRFCGMCGLPLTSWSEDASQPVVEAEPIAAAPWDEPAARVRANSDDHATVANLESDHDAENRHQPEDVLSPLAEESPVSFEMLSGYQFEPVSSSYRVYVGVVLAILLAALIYMTWRGNAAFWSSGTAPSALPRAVPAPTEAAPAAATEPPVTKTATPNPKGDTSTTAPASAPQIQKESSARPEKNRRENDRRVRRQNENARRENSRPAPRVVPVTSSSATSVAEQNGSEELAIAERYLNAGPGGARDTRQAATWLWKAVAKQNLAATILLSDLYLRGDGVTKSCDQARLLLDAAARKGGTAAAQRLRNLQAFGCQ